MNKLLRILKHRWFDERDTKRALKPDVVQRLRQRVAASERAHSGEIRLCVEAGLPLSYLWRGLTARDRAVTMFGKLRVWDTEQNNGVLIYLLLAERRIEIVADRGLNASAMRPTIACHSASGTRCARPRSATISIARSASSR